MPSRFHFGEFTLDQQRRELLRDGSALPLPNKAFEALNVLVSAAGTVVHKEDLYLALWGEKIVEDGNLAQTIHLLRTRLDESGGHSMIKTIPRVGYVFVASVRIADAACEPIRYTLTNAEISPENATLATARRLLQSGHFVAARGFLDSVAVKHVDAGTAATLLALAARAHADAGESSRGRDDLERARRILGSSGNSDSSVSLDVRMAEAYLEYRNGVYPAAIGIGSAAVTEMQIGPLRSGDAVAAARALVELATQELELGVVRDALKHLGQADALLNTLQAPVPSERCQVLIQLTFACATSAERFSLASAYANEALSLARANHLEYEHVWAELALAVLAHCAGSLRQARAHARTALILARVSMDGDQLARAYLVASRVETACGNGAAALSLLQQSWPLVKNDPLMRGIYGGAEARVRRVIGDYRGAEIAATRGIERVNSSQYIGIAYNARAWARHARGARGAAILDVEIAIDYLRRGAILADLTSALSLSFEMTKKKSHKREAAELQSVLTSQP